jgi:hypothetical protein
VPTFTFDSFGAELDKLKRDIERDGAIEVTKAMAEAAEGIAVAEAESDLGGDSVFSGWTGRDLADMQVKRIRRPPGTNHLLAPTRRSGGPWKVAEQGRNQGTATGRGGSAVFFGPGLNRRTGITSLTKTGKVRVGRFKQKRWNGYTQGKNTATNARKMMDRKLPKVAERQSVKVMRRHFDVD